MYPNLKAEQARKGMKNKEMATMLGIQQDAYERRMRSGRFVADECLKLCKFFNCSFEYLFATDDSRTA